MESIKSFVNDNSQRVKNLLGESGTTSLYNTFAILGALRVLSATSWTARNLYSNYMRSGHDLASRYGAGTWVVITGASDGIGKGFCQEFASKGFNICLVARNEEKLNAVADELKKEFKIDTRVVVLDFSKCTEFTHYENALKEMDGLDVSILVNNVGISGGGFLHEWDYQKIQDFLTVNVNAQVVFTRFFLQKMNARTQRSAVINMASLSAYLPVGNLFAMYTAAKSFNHVFSLALSEEYREKNIDVMSVTPGGVRTNLVKQYKMAEGRPMPSPRELAHGALKDLGFQDETAGLPAFKFAKNLLIFCSKSRCGTQWVAGRNKLLHESSL